MLASRRVHPFAWTKPAFAHGAANFTHSLSSSGGTAARVLATAAADLPILELVEQQRRSLAMLPTGVPALNRDQALELFEQPRAALRDLEKLRIQGDTRR
jgi:hypothetical protein